MKKYFTILVLMLLAVVASAQSLVTMGKLSPCLSEKVHQEQTLRRSAAAESRIKVLMKLADGVDEAALSEKYGFTVECRIGSVLVVSISLSQVEALAADEQVVRVEAERSGRPMLDIVPGQIGADKAWNGTANQLPQAYTGKGVVVGVVDAGFDFIHPFFRDADGKTRIKWAKDYMTNRAWTTQDAVTAAMHSSDAAEVAHGTHVAGIAAGSKVEDASWDDNPVVYQGIASEADIAEGAIDAAVTEDAQLSSATTIQAFTEIFDYAQQMQEPCVINYSVGEAMSFVNNRKLEEEAIHTLLQTPGRAIVVASGNAGSTSRLAHKTADMTVGGCGVCFNDFEQYGTYFGIEVKVKSGQTLKLRFTNSNYVINKGEAVVETDKLATTKFLMAGTRITVTAKGTTEDGYQAYYLTAGLETTFQTTDRFLVTIEGEGDAWIYADPFCAQLENVMTIENHSLAMEGYSMAWPAMLDDVVTVGNIAHRFKIVTAANKYASQGGVPVPTDITAYECTKGEGYLAKSSSVGPTIDGRMKPDVCAPGVNIVSAQNFFIDDDTYYSLAQWDIAILDTEYETWGSAAGYFHVMAQTGTSMSAPAVTGTIALWMQADPSLTTAKIKEVIAASSRQPDSELQYPNNQYGHGEIDAYRGLCYILGIDKIEGITAAQPQLATFHLNGRMLTVRFAEAMPQPAGSEVKVFSTDGRLLLTEQGTSINLSSLPHGVYAVQLNTGNKSTTGSTLIRL